MVARADTPRLTPPASPSIAAAGACLAGGLAAIGCLAGPADMIESFVVSSGLGSLVNAAAPPLGLTARMVLATGGGLLVAAVTWAVLVLVAGERRLPTALPPLRLPSVPLPAVRLPRRRPRAPGAPVVRRADSHPDAPPRPPILAERDLGVPFLSILAPADPVVDGCGLPADLDTALAAVDPAAIPDVPREPVRPVKPLMTAAAAPRAVSPAPPMPLAPGERIDSIELGADVRAQPDTIDSLLARLERGARRRPTPPILSAGPTTRSGPLAVVPEPSPESAGSLEETLGSLRRLATRG